MEAILAISVRKLVENMGDEATLKLLENFGGCRVYISNRTNSKFAALLEPDAFRGLLEAVKDEPSQHVQIPVGRFWRAHRMRRNGVSIQKIALTLGITENGAWRMLNSKAAPAWMHEKAGSVTEGSGQ